MGQSQPPHTSTPLTSKLTPNYLITFTFYKFVWVSFHFHFHFFWISLNLLASQHPLKIDAKQLFLLSLSMDLLVTFTFKGPVESQPTCSSTPLYIHSTFTFKKLSVSSLTQTTFTFYGPFLVSLSLQTDWLQTTFSLSLSLSMDRWMFNWQNICNSSQLRF